MTLMNRREWMKALGAAMLVSPVILRADHQLISFDPLLVEFDLASLAGRYTPVLDFYIRNHYDTPAVSSNRSLRIEGEVETTRNLNHQDLAPLPRHQQAAILECAGDGVGENILASNGLWEGWRFDDLLRLARPLRTARYVHLFGQDGYSRSVSIEQAWEDGMLVTRLNRQPLEPNHGAPWRALFLGWYGMDSVKWLERVVLASTPLPPVGNTYLQLIGSPSGKFIRRALPRVQVKSLIISPKPGSVLPIGQVELRGVAWSGTGRIRTVEASADGGKSWRSAGVDPGGRYGWALWRASFKLTQRGVVEFACRATDVTGATQPAKRHPSRLDGYAFNLIERVRCVVV
jgi:DMSO/TMAO reductase YedYZ molybdopterin-dependent catalytic subunit